MKAIKIVVWSLFAGMSMAGSCNDRDEEHKYFTFVNKSLVDIRCQELWQITITPADSIYQCDMTTEWVFLRDSSYSIESPGYRGGWETSFRSIPYLQLLIMDAHVFSQYRTEPCDTIRKYVPILHRYQLTLEDLQRMNWTVVYPPEE
jgi:hypothetical protein